MKQNRYTMRCIKNLLRFLKEFKDNNKKNNLKCDNIVLLESIKILLETVNMKILMKKKFGEDKRKIERMIRKCSLEIRTLTWFYK